jgi:hypothetical protein
MWDCSGDPSFEGLGERYYVGSDGAIVCGNDVRTCARWLDRFIEVCPDKPATLAMLKGDLARQNDNNIIQASNKTGDGVIDILNDILRHITSDPTINVMNIF